MLIAPKVLTEKRTQEIVRFTDQKENSMSKSTMFLKRVNNEHRKVITSIRIDPFAGCFMVKNYHRTTGKRISYALRNHLKKRESWLKGLKIV